MALVAIGLSAGCVSRPPRGSTPRPVSLAAFTRPAEPADPSSDDPAAADRSPASVPEAEVAAASEPAGGAADREQTIGAADPLAMPAPTLPPSEPLLEVGERVVVDSMVGQVNGRPIFAGRFFEPIEDQLIALGRRSTRRQFVVEANTLINEELKQVVFNALFLAEGQASLSPEEQVGLLAWGRQLQELITARVGGGSTAQADRRLQEQEDKTLAEYLQYIEDRELIRKVYQEQIEGRVIVSWRDIEREYERRYDEFNPPASVTLARIRLFTEDDADRIAAVEQRLAAGEPFLEVAESMEAGGIWQTFEVGEDGLGPEFRNETIREVLAGLTEADATSEAFQIGGSTWWLHVAEYERPEGRDLYDPNVQRVLREYLRGTRGAEEQNRFLGSLLERGIYDELDGMAERLLTIAVLRYAP